MNHPTGVEGEEAVRIIGHRGASAYLPENTLESFERAWRMGADAIELDVVMSDDGQLVVRHDNELSTTTDVAQHPEFADRRGSKSIDGVEHTGWFTEDFTLPELRTLRAVERLPQLRAASASYDGRFAVPTLQSVLDLQWELVRELERPLCVQVEIKHPAWHATMGYDMGAAIAELFSSVDAAVFGKAPVWLQSFELGVLRSLRHDYGVGLPMLFNVEDGGPPDFLAAGIPKTYGELLEPASLEQLRPYVDSIGPDKEMILPSVDGMTKPASTLVHDAHALGMAVYPWTLRAENEFLPAALRRGSNPALVGDFDALLDRFAEAEVDGFFTDQPDLAISWARRRGIA